MAPVIKGIRLGAGQEVRTQTTMRLDRDVADVMRRLARYEGKRLSQLLSDMLVVYCRETHPQMELVIEGE